MQSLIYRSANRNNDFFINSLMINGIIYYIDKITSLDWSKQDRLMVLACSIIMLKTHMIALGLPSVSHR